MKKNNYQSFKIVVEFQTPHPRTAIEAEILFAARIKHLRFLGAVIKPVHPCTGLIARFAQQNAHLLRTTDIRAGTEKKNIVGTKKYTNPDGKIVIAPAIDGASMLLYSDTV